VNDRTPEIAFDRWVPFDGFVHGKVSDRVVSVYKYSVCINVHSGLRGGRGGLFWQDDHSLAFAMAVGFKSRLLDKPAELTRTGTAMAAMKTERNRDRVRFHEWVVLPSGLAHNRTLTLYW